MATEDVTESWYWGEMVKTDVDSYLKDKPQGTFLVYKHQQSNQFTLAYRVDGKTENERILSEDELFGFAEPLGFNSLSECLDAFNNAVMTEGLLKIAADPSTHPICNVRVASQLKTIRDIVRRKIEKEDELDRLHEQLSDQEDLIEDNIQTIAGFQQLSNMMDIQFTRHENLSEKVANTADANHSTILTENHAALVKRRDEINKKRDVIKQELLTNEEKRNPISREYLRCRGEVEVYHMHLTKQKREILQTYPQILEFLECLLWDDLFAIQNINVVDISEKEADKILSQAKHVDGVFMIRRSNKDTTIPYKLYVSYDERVLKIGIKQLDHYLGLDDTTCIFTDLDDLVNSYMKIPFRVHNKDYGELTLIQPFDQWKDETRIQAR